MALTFNEIKALAQETANESEHNEIVREAMTRFLVKVWHVEEERWKKEHQQERKHGTR